MDKKHGRADNQKQIWMRGDDREKFQKVAERLERQGIDVRYGGEYSITKVLRHLLNKELLNP